MICWHLRHHTSIRVSPATISRYLARAGLVIPEPRKRPKSSCIRFQAEQPNQCWQSDFTHYPLADGTGTEVLTSLDDHSRYALSVTAWNRVTGPIVLAAFRATVQRYGPPASTLTDNGMVFTTRFSGGKGGRNGLEAELRRLGTRQKNGRPNHPQTQGKAERFQQTLKNWLTAQDPQPADLPQLQALLNAFTHIYNHQRPAPVPAHRATPATAYAARPKAAPGDRTADTHDRVRTDRINTNGVVTLRHGGKLYHIGIGRTQRPNPRDQPLTTCRSDVRRRHRRTTPRAHPRPRPQLPAHRPAPQTHNPDPPQTTKPRTLTWVRVSSMS